MLKAIIVDDEQKSRENLKILLQDFCQNVEVLGMGKSVAEGLELIETLRPDILFLDIQMQRETGFDLLNKLPQINFEVVFTTAHSEYAIEAIKFSAIDYLLKPIDITDLQKAVQKVASRVHRSSFKEQFEVLLQNFRNDSSEGYKIALPTSDGLIFISFRDIVFCEAMSNYTQFHMKDGKKHLVSRTLKEYESMLANYHFFRIHNSYLINVREIRRYIKGDGGQVLMSNDVALDVSKRRKDAFLSKISATNLF